MALTLATWGSQNPKGLVSWGDPRIGRFTATEQHWLQNATLVQKRALPPDVACQITKQTCILKSDPLKELSTKKIEGQMCNAFRKKLFLWLSLQTHAAFKHGFATWQQCHLATLHFKHSQANRYYESIVSSGGDICWYWSMYLNKSINP